MAPEGSNILTMNNVPEHWYKTWTFYKTGDRMKMLCNGVEAWSFLYRALSEQCHVTMSRDTNAMIFTSPAPTIFYKPAGN